MPEFLDSTGKIVFLGRELGRGGEGIVYEVVDKPELVAKIYHEPISDDKAEKLRQMVALQSEKLLRLAAWVTEVLHVAPSGKVAGFLMPRLNSGNAVHELYNPKSRRKHYPEADWRFLVRAAANLARAFSVVHTHGHAIGDVNHGNVLIARDATVRLIDCDSYHLNAPEQSFLCEVGVSTHTPPELQGKSLREVERTANHDAFGLSVMIFQLLFMGRHPFSGTYLGDGENTLENSIKESRFAYGDDAANRLMRQPPGTLPLAAVSTQAAKLFERAFLTVENRPSAREWVETLENLEENLHGCSINSAHYFYKGLSKCPWCALEAQTGVLFFAPRFTGEFSADGELDLVTLGRLIDAIKPPELSQNLPVLTQNQLVPATPTLPLSQKIEEALEGYNLGLGVFLVVLGFSVFWLTAIAGIGFLCPLGFLILFICLHVTSSLTRKAREAAQLALDESHYKWQSFKEEWQKTAQAKSFETARAELKKFVQEYRELPSLRDKKLKKLGAAGYEEKLEIYLKTYSIRRADTIEIDGERLEILRENGIRTAADITKKKFNKIPYFSHFHKRKLFEWRDELEKKFVYKPFEKLSKGEVEEVETEVASIRRHLETKIREGFPKLQQISVQIGRKYNDLAMQSETLAARLAQAESDFKRVLKIKSKTNTWTVAVVVTALLIGIPVNIYNHSQSRELESFQNQRDGYGIKSTENFLANTAKTYKNEKEKEYEDWGEAATFYYSGEAHFSGGRFKDAVNEYRRAIRLNPEVGVFHQRLGDSYYQLHRFSEAVQYYKNAEQLDENNAKLMFYLGVAYKKTGQIDKAISALERAAKLDYQDQSIFYELGLALKETGKTKQAIENLQKAVYLDDDLTDAHYEIGLCFVQMGERNKAWYEYEKIQYKDKELARKLLVKFQAKFSGEKGYSEPMLVVKENDLPEVKP